jgi:hypothetical protein
MTVPPGAALGYTARIRIEDRATLESDSSGIRCRDEAESREGFRFRKESKFSSWPKAINSGVWGGAPIRMIRLLDRFATPPFVSSVSLRELFRPTSHLSALQEQELLRHGFRNHKDSPHCGLDWTSALTRFSDEDTAATAGCGSR